MKSIIRYNRSASIVVCQKSLDNGSIWFATAPPDPGTISSYSDLFFIERGMILLQNSQHIFLIFKPISFLRLVICFCHVNLLSERSPKYVTSFAIDIFTSFIRIFGNFRTLYCVCNQRTLRFIDFCTPLAQQVKQQT